MTPDRAALKATIRAVRELFGTTEEVTRKLVADGQIEAACSLSAAALRATEQVVAACASLPGFDAGFVRRGYRESEN